MSSLGIDSIRSFHWKRPHPECTSRNNPTAEQGAGGVPLVSLKKLKRLFRYKAERKLYSHCTKESIKGHGEAWIINNDWRARNRRKKIR